MMKRFIAMGTASAALIYYWHSHSYHYYDERNESSVKKDLPRLVILGCGWGAVGVLKTLRTTPDYEITVIAPRTYFLFTPLLPSTTVGTLESRSIIEPVRAIVQRVRGRYFEARAHSINREKKIVTCLGSDDDKFFEIPYDVLVIAIGADSITYGMPNVVEKCHQLKTIEDARAIRAHIVGNFEKASLPLINEQERDRLLSFVVVGGGPTGVEFAAELYDLFQHDMVRYYGTELMKHAKITLLQSADHILNTYDEQISAFTEQQFQRREIRTITNARVTEVQDNNIVYKDTLNNTKSSVPYGMCVWTTGIGMKPMVRTFKAAIPEQNHTRALLVDQRLRIIGHYDRDIYALGDCATMAIPRTVELVKEMIAQHSTFTYQELDRLTLHIASMYPQVALHMKTIRANFRKYARSQSADSSWSSSRIIKAEDIRSSLEALDRQLKSLPATAQVAVQQGRFIGRHLNNIGKSVVSNDRSKWRSGIKWPSDLALMQEPFRYRHLGSAAYVGGEQAVFDFGHQLTESTLLAIWLWRGVYLSQQVSLRLRISVLFDWIRVHLYGRDISLYAESGRWENKKN